MSATGNMADRVSFWDRTKQYSNTAYEKALKPGFDKAYNVVNKLEPHINKFSHKVGSETFWPGELDKESEKCARVLRSFCKDGVYDHIDEATAKKAEEDGTDIKLGVPQGKQRVLKKIPASVIQNAKGLCIFTCMRYGWVIGGSGGAGVLIGRHPETGEWSPPSGIHMSNISFGFLIGADLTDTVLVINTYEALEAFTKLRCTLGTEVGVAAGPLGMGGMLETSVNKKPAPVWSYVKSRGLYGGVSVDGNIIIERTDENERFYDERVGVAQILRGEIRRPPIDKYKVLLDTIKAAQGDEVDESLLPDGVAPSDMELAPEGPVFGIPDEDDPDPFGFKALEAQGMTIREAGTHRRATPESFEFKPSPTSPVYNTYRKSMDVSLRRKEWRNSTISVSSTDRGTQTGPEDEGMGSPARTESPPKYSETVPSLPLRKVEGTEPHKQEKKDIATEGPIVPQQSGDEIAKDIPGEKVIATETEHKKSSDLGADRSESGAKLNGEPERPETNGEEADQTTDDSDDDYSDFESDVEIITAVPVTARPKAGVVNIPQRVAPALPPRNPGRVGRSPLLEQSAKLGESDATELQNDEGVERETKAVDVTTANDEVRQSVLQTHLTPGAHQAEEEFHSIPPTPVDEKPIDGLQAQIDTKISH